jgi:hypothetical protein
MNPTYDFPRSVARPFFLLDKGREGMSEHEKKCFLRVARQMCKWETTRTPKMWVAEMSVDFSSLAGLNPK